MEKARGRWGTVSLVTPVMRRRGIEVPIARAVAWGDKIIEKHFTTDRNLKGNDHKVSLLPDEFGSMVRSIRHVEEALGTASVRQATPGELMNRVESREESRCGT